MDIQRKIVNILYDYDQYLRRKYNRMQKISHGYEKGRLIFSNAKIHVNKKYLLNMDLENFFPSIHFGRFKGFWKELRLQAKALCCG